MLSHWDFDDLVPSYSSSSFQFCSRIGILWQESPSFYGYMLGFLMLSLLLYSIKLKITSRTIYYTLAGYRISLCLYREAVHYSFINPQYDSLKARTKRWLTRLPAHQINQRDGTLDFYSLSVQLARPALFKIIPDSFIDVFSSAS